MYFLNVGFLKVSFYLDYCRQCAVNTIIIRSVLLPVLAMGDLRLQKGRKRKGMLVINKNQYLFTLI